MFIDVIVVILLVMALFKGLSKGFVVAVFSFLAFIIVLAAAIKLSAVVAVYLGKNVSVSERWLPVLAFALVFIVVALLIRLGARMLEGVLQLMMLGWLNRLGGVVFFALLYLFVFSVVLFYATQVHIISAETAQASVTYPYLQPLAPYIINAIGVLLPFFKNMFAQLLHFFEGRTTGR
ncbi:MAG: CvpA family protein [Flavisolibacter sp.]|nr:CvpA family protein [Flavisolibacter sp.]